MKLATVLYEATMDFQDEDEQSEFYVVFADWDQEKPAGIGKIEQMNGKWEETDFLGEAPLYWGERGGTYMSYLTPQEIKSWLNKDYRNYDVYGPFDTFEEAKEVAAQRGPVTEASKQLGSPKSPRKGTVAWNRQQREREQYLKDFAKDPHGKLKAGDHVGAAKVVEGFAMDDIAIGGTVIYKTKDGYKMSKARSKGPAYKLQLANGDQIENAAVVSTDASDWNHYKNKSINEASDTTGLYWKKSREQGGGMPELVLFGSKGDATDYKAVFFKYTTDGAQFEYSKTSVNSNDRNGPTIRFGTNKQKFDSIDQLAPFAAKLGLPELTSAELAHLTDANALHVPLTYEIGGRTRMVALPKTFFDDCKQKAKGDVGDFLYYAAGKLKKVFDYSSGYKGMNADTKQYLTDLFGDNNGQV